MPRFETLQGILPASAREDRRITFIEGEHEQRAFSFRQLRQRASGVLGALQRRGLGAGDRVILFVADNERFVEMFWACVLGGIVPVPLSPGATDEHRRKLFQVFAQCDPASVYIDGRALDRLAEFAAAHGLEADAGRLRSAAMIPGSLDIAGAPGQAQQVGPEDLAFIQYSSGSTGEPKGVMLTHRNLTANIASIIEASAASDRDRALSWMPLSHDMGLIGFHLKMLAGGITHAIMRTELFARRPLLWLELASEHRSTLLCSPNFGYQHYLRQYALKPPQRLDLSTVRLIYNGAEPISAELCRRFTATMASHGLKPQSLFTVYGLAEASLAVSFPRLGTGLRTLEIERTSLRIGAPVRVSPQTSASRAAAHTAEFVKLGGPVPGTEVRIVDMAGTTLDAERLGHVQIRGDNVSQGYYRDEARTARLRSADGWFDTGDLGLIVDGELVITGRAKDLVIVNGQNYHPHDLERIAEQVPGVEINRVVAAGVRSLRDSTEELALFVLHRGGVKEFVPTALALRRTLNQQTGLEVAQVVPVRQIPKTSSGKLQRYQLAQAFEDGEFDGVLAELRPLLAATDGADADDSGATPTVRRLLGICRALVPGTELTAQTNLMEINLSSLTLARIHEAIEREFPQRIEVTDLFDYPTLEQLATVLNAPGG